MRAAAKIHKVTLRVGRNRLSVLEALDQLHLILFTAGLEEFDCFLFGEFLSGDRELTFRNLDCASLDLLKILRGKGPVVRKVVVKTVFERRANRQLCRRIKLFHRLCHEVGAAMPIDFPTFCAVEAKGFNRRVLRYDGRKIRRLSVDRGGKQIRAGGDSSGSEGLDYGLTLRNFIRCPVLERYLRHEILTSFMLTRNHPFRQQCLSSTMRTQANLCFRQIATRNSIYWTPKYKRHPDRLNGQMPR